MARAYKHSNGRIQFRAGNGRFRDATLRDFGVTNENSEGDTYICNRCEREFVPILKSGICCGVDDKRLKPKPPVPEDEQLLLEKIDTISSKPFISRQDLDEINKLRWELDSLKRSQRQSKNL